MERHRVFAFVIDIPYFIGDKVEPILLSYRIYDPPSPIILYEGELRVCSLSGGSPMDKIGLLKKVFLYEGIGQSTTMVGFDCRGKRMILSGMLEGEGIRLARNVLDLKVLGKAMYPGEDITLGFLAGKTNTPAAMGTQTERTRTIANVFRGLVKKISGHTEGNPSVGTKRPRAKLNIMQKEMIFAFCLERDGKPSRIYSGRSLSEKLTYSLHESGHPGAILEGEAITGHFHDGSPLDKIKCLKQLFLLEGKGQCTTLVGFDCWHSERRLSEMFQNSAIAATHDIIDLKVLGRAIFPNKDITLGFLAEKARVPLPGDTQSDRTRAISNIFIALMGVSQIAPRPTKTGQK